jgi:predicted outer membrane repeat protein
MKIYGRISISLVCWLLAPALILVAGIDLAPVRAARPSGATIVVTSNSPYTGGPTCKLRDAIKAANTGTVVGGCNGRGAGPYTIVLQPGTAYTLNQVDNTGESGVNGLPQITANITINGRGSTIQRAISPGNGTQFRFFQVNQSGVLGLKNVSIQNGETDQGGAIYSNGTVNIANSSFISNRSQCGGAIANGETGNLSITNTSFRFSDAYA